MITVLIADDHEIVRHAITASLKAEQDINVIAEAGDGRRAVELADRLSPQIVILDIAMPDLNGIEATRQIVSNTPHVGVIALSALDDKKTIEEVLRAGARGYVLKESAFRELTSAIRAVASGHTYLSPEITSLLVEAFVNQTQGSASSPFSQLTAREREILQLVAEGKTIKEIADKLSVSAKTVHTHRANLMDKLKLHSNAELTKYAVREGLTSP